MSDTCSVEQAAALLHVHEKTLLDLIAKGHIPAATVGRAYVMLTKDVLAYLQMLITKQTAERSGPKPRERKKRRASRGVAA